MTPRFTLHAALLHPTQPVVLACRQPGDSLTLPAVPLADYPLDDSPAAVSVLAEALGTDVWALQCLHRTESTGEAHQVDDLWVLESRCGWEPPSDAVWLDYRRVADLRLTVPEHAALLSTWLEGEMRGAIPSLRAPWARRGWAADVMDWLRDNLPGRDPIEAYEIEQWRTWSLSCLLRIRGGQREVYFKAVTPHFSQEPVITAALSARFPDLVPEILAIEPDRGWMLMAPFEGGELRGMPLPAWEETLRRLAEVQIACAGEEEELLAAGFADRRLRTMDDALDAVLAEGTETGLQPEEQNELEALAPHIRHWCRQLAEYRIPETIVHGDFHDGNIRVASAGPIFFDWTDAAVAHPFMDLLVFLYPRRIPEGADVRRQLEDAYLQAWASYESPRRLREALRLAGPISALYHAISYRNLTASIEEIARWEMDGGYTRFLRRLIQMAGELRAEAPDLSDL